MKGKVDTQLKKGLLDGCVLAALQNEPSYGYKIISDIAPYLEISESTLYPILKRLETAGALRTFSREYNGRLRKYYEITPIGRRKLRECILDLEELFAIYRFLNGGYHHD